MNVMASQITCVSIVWSTVGSGADQRKYQICTSLAFVTGEFPTQKASNAENVSICWRQHENPVTLATRAKLLYLKTCHVRL